MYWAVYCRILINYIQELLVELWTRFIPLLKHADKIIFCIKNTCRECLSEKNWKKNFHLWTWKTCDEVNRKGFWKVMSLYLAGQVLLNAINILYIGSSVRANVMSDRLSSHERNLGLVNIMRGYCTPWPISELHLNNSFTTYMKQIRKWTSCMVPINESEH